MVVTGHSHRPKIDRRSGVLYVNPGSAGPVRFKLPVSVALMQVSGKDVTARIVELESLRPREAWCAPGASRHEPSASSASARRASRTRARASAPCGAAARRAEAGFASRDWYDVWFPNLSPSPELVKRALASQSDPSAAGDKEWAGIHARLSGGDGAPENAHAIALLAALSRQTDFSVGCYCEDEARCHRSVLRELLGEAGAKVAQ